MDELQAIENKGALFEDTENALREAREPEIEEIEEQLSEDPVRTLTIAKRNPLGTRFIEYVPLLPSYPRTDALGFTYVLPIPEQARNGDKWKDLIEHQYSCHRAMSPRSASSSFFGGIPNKGIKGTMWRWKCSGVKCCQYIDPRIRNVSHTQTSIEELAQTRNLSEQFIAATDADPRRRNAIKAYWTIRDRFSKGIACRTRLTTCQPVFGRFRHVSDTHGTRNYFVKCCHYSAGTASTKAHLFHQWNINDVIDWDFLKSYYDGGIVMEQQCFRVEGMSSRMENCGIPHPQGPGTWEPRECDVKFHAFVPDDRLATPWLFFMSSGIHSHPPPPPTRTPERYLRDLRQLIDSANTPDLTFVRFQTSPALKQYLQDNGVASLNQLHISLANTGRLSHEIQRHRLLHYPEGTQLAGTVFEFEKQKLLPIHERYIQQLYNDENGLMIICFYKEAANLLLNEPDLEVDMSFKRIRQADMNEILFARFLESHDKIVTFARIIVARDTTTIYKLAFQRVFQLIANITERPVQWYYLHGRGFRAVIVDMLAKQAAGIGEYLKSIEPIPDPSHDWRWHIRHVIVYCTIHFERTIHKAIGTSPQQEGLRGLMKSLRTAATVEEYYAITQTLKHGNHEQARNWAKHKETALIRCGLQHYFSYMDSTYFMHTRNTTNAVEQAANKGYASGTRMNLLPAIQKAGIRDLADIEAWKAREHQSVHHVWRSNSAIQRGSGQLRRAQTAKLGPSSLRVEEETPDPTRGSMLPPSSPALRSSPAPSAVSSQGTVRRKRPISGSVSSQSDTYRKRSAHNLAANNLTDRDALASVVAKELANEREKLQLQKETLEFERQQRQFQKEIERERAEAEAEAGNTY